MASLFFLLVRRAHPRAHSTAHSVRASRVAERATRTGMPLRRASAAVCSPMHMPVMRERSAPSPTVARNPFTVEAEVKVTRSTRPSSTASRRAWLLGLR